MKKTITLIIFILSIFLFIQIVFNWSTEKATLSLNTDYSLTLRQDLFSLMMAYPENIVDIEVVDNTMVYLILKSGSRLLYDDFKDKTDSEKLQNPDLQDMMMELYTMDSINSLMPKEYNPGRIRVYPLLKEVYGAHQWEIENNLTGVRIHSSHHRFNDNNLAVYHLKKALTELDQLLKNVPGLWSYVYPIGGTYNFRYISNTNRLSPHAFGISIDFAINKDDYWQWTTRKAGEKRIVGYPKEIVSIMEQNYFIWGGKWGLFDILHFEYRPEIIIKGQYFADAPKDLWYEHLPVKDERVTNTILLIEERLRDFYLP